MKVAFRVDANARIGSGHLVRCATLARELRARGAEPLLLCRGLPQTWQAWLEGLQLPWRELGEPREAFTAGEGDVPHAGWLGTSWAADAQDTLEALRPGPWDWLVVDHYALDVRWERALRTAARRLLAIDDLADRGHDVDALLDLNLYERAESRYAGRVPGSARLMLGPRFALLRPEFSAARAALAPRVDVVRRVLVFFGGFDAHNTTGRVLQALEMLRRDGIGPFAVDAVIGALHPAREELEAYCAQRRGWTCHVQTERMAELMGAADLAIGAGGGATWERCALGLPTLAVPQAANQVVQVQTAAQAGVVCAPHLREDGPEAWRVHIEALWFDPLRRRRLAEAAHALVDGRGAERVARFMLQPKLRVREAVRSDSVFVYTGRNDESVRRVSRSAEPIAPEAHQRWFEAVLTDARRSLLIGCLGDEPVGVLRWDLSEDGLRAEVSLYLAPGRTSQGLGPDLLAAGEAWLRSKRPGVRRLVAEVLAGNAASTHLFEQAGYAMHSQHYEKGLTSS